MTRNHAWMLLPLVAALGCGSSKHNPPASTDMAMELPAPDLAVPAAPPDMTAPPVNTTLGSDGGYEGDGGLDITGSNVVPVIVDNGPNNIGSANVPFVSVTVCVPGTTTCATIDHILVDTGSTGLRLISKAMPQGFTLPAVKATDGNPMTECFAFITSFVYGSVVSADLKMGGETAANIPLQLMGDPTYPDATIPTSCNGGDTSENDGDSVDAFGANGIIGINQWINDCGSECAAATADPKGYTFYYSCVGTTCTYVPVPLANQLPNPVIKFAVDNNGAIMQFPEVSQSGALDLPGVLIFGIDTQTNNALGKASVVPVDDNGYFTTTYKGTAMKYSYLDSGTSLLYFTDTSIPEGTGQDDQGFYIPPSPLNLSAQLPGVGATSINAYFTVANADELFMSNNTAFNDVAVDGGDSTSFAWGFNYFIGRRIYTAFALPANNNGNGYNAF